MCCGNLGKLRGVDAIRDLTKQCCGSRHFNSLSNFDNWMASQLHALPWDDIGDEDERKIATTYLRSTVLSRTLRAGELFLLLYGLLLVRLATTATSIAVASVGAHHALEMMNTGDGRINVMARDRLLHISIALWHLLLLNSWLDLLVWMGLR